MPRYKYIDTQPKLLPVDLTRQFLPGTFEHAVNHPLDHAIDLATFDARFRNDAIEDLSPDDRQGEVVSKVGEWLSAGVKLAWVLDLDRRIAHVHRPDGSLSLVDVDGALEGENVLPGFRCMLKDLVREQSGRN